MYIFALNNKNYKAMLTETMKSNDYNKGFQDAIEKAKQIIIHFAPLPSHKNHNINYNVNLLIERQKYALRIAEKFEKMMKTKRKGV